MTTNKLRYASLLAFALAAPVHAGETLDAAIGGGLGGAAGAAIGNEIGGREGAILGGALGAATGAAITTSGDGGGAPHGHVEYPHYGGTHYHGGHFCPPGQAKKGRC